MKNFSTPLPLPLPFSSRLLFPLLLFLVVVAPSTSASSFQSPALPLPSSVSSAAQLYASPSSVHLTADASLALLGLHDAVDEHLGQVLVFASPLTSSPTSSTASSGNWTLATTLRLPASLSSAPNDFGASISTTIDASYIVVGAPRVAQGLGLVHVLARVGTSLDWQLVRELSPPLPAPSDPSPLPRFFGTSVSISSDGAALVVGASEGFGDPSAAHVYVQGVDNAWELVSTLRASASAGVGTASPRYATSVSAACGALTAAVLSIEQAGVKLYLYSRLTASWGLLNTLSVLQAVPASSADYGMVAISNDELVVAVGVFPGVSSASNLEVYVREGASTWHRATLNMDAPTEAAFGFAMSMSLTAERLAFGFHDDENHGVAVLERDGDTLAWTEVRTLAAPLGADASAGIFGKAVSMSGDGKQLALVQDVADTDVLTGPGALYVVGCATGFADLDANECVEEDRCPVGFFCDLTWPFQVHPCPGGTYGTEDAATDDSVCDECPLGHHCPPGTATPIPCPAGSFCPAGSNDPTPCPAGSYSSVESASGAWTCAACLPGAYCPEGSASPTPCPAGTFNGATSSSNSSACQECTAGSSCPLFSANPLPCPAGYYCPAQARAPTPCPGGTFSNTAMATSDAVCQTCQPGFYCPTGSTSQLSCPAGTFNSVASGSSLASCFACPSGFYCPAEATSPSACTAGTYNPLTSSHNVSACLTCERGYYCGDAARAQEPCAAGTYSNNTAATSASTCLACPTGFYCEAASPLPVTCPAGSFCGDGVGSPTVCPAGAYCESMSSFPSPCPTGTSSPNPGAVNASACELCPAGWFCPSTDLPRQPCPNGTYSTQTGATDDSLCLSCQPGYYCPIGAGEQVPCTTTSYCPEGSVAPLTCPAGAYCPDDQLNAEPTQCPAGTYSLATGQVNQTTCELCPAGWYCADTSQPPVACPDGTFSSKDGAVDTSACEACRAGYYCHIGASVEAECSTGSYCPERSTAPTACPAGTYCPSDTLNSAPVPCPVGTFSDTVGASSPGTCEACPVGSYCPAQSTAPLECPAGYYCPPSPPIADPLPCAPGTFSKTVGASDVSTCEPCPKGWYCELGCAEPITCPDGFATPDDESDSVSECVVCPAGFVCTAASGEAACPAGSYCPGGTAVPTECPSGHYCPVGSVEPTECPSGTFRTFPGAYLFAQCTPCPSGTYGPQPALSVCTRCPANFGCVQGSVSPSRCPAGTRAESGSTRCVSCGPGKQVALDDGTTCARVYESVKMYPEKETALLVSLIPLAIVLLCVRSSLVGAVAVFVLVADIVSDIAYVATQDFADDVQLFLAVMFILAPIFVLNTIIPPNINERGRGFCDFTRIDPSNASGATLSSSYSIVLWYEQYLTRVIDTAWSIFSYVFRLTSTFLSDEYAKFWSCYEDVRPCGLHPSLQGCGLLEAVLRPLSALLVGVVFVVHAVLWYSVILLLACAMLFVDAVIGAIGLAFVIVGVAIYFVLWLLSPVLPLLTALALFLFGQALYATRLIVLPHLRSSWQSWWQCRNLTLKGVPFIDSVVLTRVILMHALTQSLPQLCLQIANNEDGGSWNTIAILSLVISATVLAMLPLRLLCVRTDKGTSEPTEEPDAVEPEAPQEAADGGDSEDDDEYGEAKHDEEEDGADEPTPMEWQGGSTRVLHRMPVGRSSSTAEMMEMGTFDSATDSE